MSEESAVMKFLRKRCTDPTVRKVTDAWFTMAVGEKNGGKVPYLFDLHVSSNYNGMDEVKDKVLCRTINNHFTYDDIRDLIGRTEAEVKQIVYGSDEDEFHRALDILYASQEDMDVLFRPADDGGIVLEESHPLVAHIKEVCKSFTFESDWYGLSALISGEMWAKRYAVVNSKRFTFEPGTFKIARNENRITFLLKCLNDVFNCKEQSIEVYDGMYFERDENEGTIWYLVHNWTVSHDEVAAKAILALNRILLRRDGSIDYVVLRHMTDAGFLITNMEVDEEYRILTGSLIHIDVETGKLDSLGVWLNNPDIPSWARHPYGGRR